MYRIIDFKRNDHDGMPAQVTHIEYDPNRSARIALILYPDGEKRYIIAPEGLKAGHDRHQRPDRRAQGRQLPAAVARSRPACRSTTSRCSPAAGPSSAGRPASAATLTAREGTWAQITLPSGEVRRIPAACRATIGMVGNSDHMNIRLGKAGRTRWLGRRPHVRGVAMNPVDHPMGGGEGRTSGGRHPCSPTGKLAKGGKTRRRRKPSNSAIIRRRKSVRYGQLKV